MANKKELKELMDKRSPLRKTVTPVDMYGVKETKEVKAVTPSARTVQANGDTERFIKEEEPSIITEINQGVHENKRQTERYSFEIYSDQIDKIEELQYKYKKRTGKKIPASRIIREALEAYLNQIGKELK